MAFTCWVVRTTSYFENFSKAFSQTEITLETRAEARKVMAAQKLLARHATLHTEVELFKAKVVPFDDTRHTIFYTKAR